MKEEMVFFASLEPSVESISLGLMHGIGHVYKVIICCLVY